MAQKYIPLSAPPPPDFPGLSSNPGTTSPPRAEYSPWPVSPDTGVVRPTPFRTLGRLRPGVVLFTPLAALRKLPASLWASPLPRTLLDPLSQTEKPNGCHSCRDVLSRLTRRPAFPLPAELSAALWAAGIATPPSAHIRRRRCTR